MVRGTDYRPSLWLTTHSTSLFLVLTVGWLHTAGAAYAGSGTYFVAVCAEHPVGPGAPLLRKAVVCGELVMICEFFLRNR